MKKFMAVYTGSAAAREKSGFDKLDDAARKKVEDQGMQAWMAWGDKHQKAIRENGGPLGKTKRVSKDGITDIKNNLAGYTVVEAESHDAAAKMFLNHPHFSIFPGDGVEIMEILAIPGQ